MARCDWLSQMSRALHIAYTLTHVTKLILLCRPPRGWGAVSNAVIRRSVCLMHARSPKQCILRSMGYYSIKKLMLEVEPMVGVATGHGHRKCTAETGIGPEYRHVYLTL